MGLTIITSANKGCYGLRLFAIKDGNDNNGLGYYHLREQGLLRAELVFVKAHQR